jgi:hypothetical protein
MSERPVGQWLLYALSRKGESDKSWTGLSFGWIVPALKRAYSFTTVFAGEAIR